MIYAAIPAGGTGSRMGADVPKQFISVKGKPIIIRTIEAFECLVDEVVVGILPEWKEHLDECIRTYLYNSKLIVRVVSGADSRTATLLNVIREIEAINGINNDDIVITHDAVRPFINERIVRENIEMCKKYGAAATYVPAIDTIAVSQDGKIIDSVPERKNLYNAQTPQTVKLTVLKEIIEKIEGDPGRYTDLCGLLTEYGQQIAIVRGEYTNIKITNPADIKTAEGIIGE